MASLKQEVCIIHIMDGYAGLCNVPRDSKSSPVFAIVP